MAQQDLGNRDPNNLNDHLQSEFHQVLAEPDAVHSMDCTWKLSYACFNFWRDFCYKLSTFFCGCCIAMELGCEFANIMFTHIWFITPMLRVCAINCHPYQKLWGICCNCCVSPACESCGMLFSKFKVQLNKS